MSNKLYVGNISYQTTEESLRGMFEDGGFSVQSVNIIMDRNTGQSKGFGFVELDSADAAQGAIDSLDGKEVDGRPIRVNVARERQDRGGGGGGNRDRY